MRGLNNVEYANQLLDVRYVIALQQYYSKLDDHYFSKFTIC